MDLITPHVRHALQSLSLSLSSSSLNLNMEKAPVSEEAVAATVDSVASRVSTLEVTEKNESVCISYWSCHRLIGSQNKSMPALQRSNIRSIMIVVACAGTQILNVSQGIIYK